MKIFVALYIFSTITLIRAGKGKAPPKLHIEGGPTYFEWATKSLHFVDKTGLLRIFTRSTRILITCPTNFGKTVNLDMIRRFFEMGMNPNTGLKTDKKKSASYRLFTDKSLNLEIAQDVHFVENHLGEYAMLYFNFDNVHGDTSKELITSINGVIKNVFESYRWMYKIMVVRNSKNKNDIFPVDIEHYANVMDGNPDQDAIISGLDKMMKFLEKQMHRKSFVIIDNYDTPVMHAISKGIETKEIEEYIHLLIETILKTKWGIRAFVIAGVSRFLNTEGALKSIDHYYFLEEAHQVGQFFGFTESEVDELLAMKNIESSEREKIKAYYNGYHFKKKSSDDTLANRTSLYNPSGVVEYLESNTFDEDDTTDDITLKIMKCLKHDHFFFVMSSLLSNKRARRTTDFHIGKGDMKIFADTLENNCSTCDNDVLYFTYLQDNGYLSYAEENEYSEIPNNVIQNKLLRAFHLYFLETYGIDMANSTLAACLSTILNSETTTDDMLYALANSLNQLLKPVCNTPLDEFRYQSITFGAIIGKLNETKDVKLKDIDTAKEEYITGYHILRFVSDDQKTLLIARIAFREGLEDAVELVHQYAPLEPRAKSTFTLVKYIAINLDEKNRAEVAKAESRSEW